MSTEQEIRHAVEQFYAALSATLTGDAAPMLALWADGPEATVMHPGGGRQVGREEVRAAWEGWAGAVRDGRIEPADVTLRLLTPDVACVSAVERGEGTVGDVAIDVDQRATLVLRRDAGGWKAVHHHVDVIPALRDLMAAAAA